MTAYVMDIEGDGLSEVVIDHGKIIPGITRVHLLVLRELATNKVHVYRNNDKEDTIAEGWGRLKKASLVIGHNIISYDIPVLCRFYGKHKVKMFDTLVAARLLWPDVTNHPFGGNGVDDFGKLLGVPKVGADIKDWSKWTPLMEQRCITDTEIQLKIFNYLKPKLQKFKTALRLEMKVAEIIADQMENGVEINVPLAEKYIEQFTLERAGIYDSLQRTFPPVIEEMKSFWWLDEAGNKYMFKKNAPKGTKLVKGPNRTREHPFNPGSAQQIAARFKERYGWDAPRTKPTPNCPEGNPSITEEVLLSLEYPEAEMLLRYAMLEKRLQHLADWVARARASRTPGRIHPFINPLGTNTGRASHQQPNQTACPKVLSGKDGPLMGYEGRYGFEMRSIWGPRPGWVQVGGDASGIELRLLANAMAPWDNGAYCDVVVNGDVHTTNMNAGGLLTRPQSKEAVYAALYGSGRESLGITIATHPSLSQEQRAQYAKRSKKRIGSEFLDTFLKNLPALGKLIDWVKHNASQYGYVVLLDGRHAPTRSDHSALNVLLQGNGAVVMKLAMVILWKELSDRGWWLTRCAPMLWPHDEFQYEAEPEIADEVGKLIVQSIREAGKRLRCVCPLDGEYKVGRNWAETH